MYQKTAYPRWVEASRKVFDALAQMRQDERLAEKVAAHAARNKEYVLVGDVFASYVSMRCGADDYKANHNSLSLRFDEMIVDVMIPDEIIALIEKVMRTMVSLSIERCVRNAGEKGPQQ